MHESFSGSKELRESVAKGLWREDRRAMLDGHDPEMAKEIFKKETKQKYLKIIDKLIKDGAEGIILGCTEIPILIKQSDVSVPLFDTTLIHATAIADFALNE